MKKTITLYFCDICKGEKTVYDVTAPVKIVGGITLRTFHACADCLTEITMLRNVAGEYEPDDLRIMSNAGKHAIMLDKKGVEKG